MCCILESREHRCPVFWKHPPQHDHVQASVLLEYPGGRPGGRLPLRDAKAQGSGTCHPLPGVQAPRLPGPAPSVRWTIQVLSVPGGKKKAFLIVQKDSLWKRMPWYCGEKRKKTQGNPRDRETALPRAAGYSPSTSQELTRAGNGLRSAQPRCAGPRPGHSRPFYLQSPGNRPSSVCPPLRGLY